MPQTQAAPAKEKYAVVYQEHTHVPGDERSRTHPGHGYPAHTETHNVFKGFDTEPEFLDWVKRAKLGEYGMPRSFQAYKCIPVEVSVEVHTKVNLG